MNSAPLIASSKNLPDKVAIIAGQGDFPILIAQAAVAAGTQVVCFCVIGFASKQLPVAVSESGKCYWLELGQLGKALEIMKAEGVHHLVLAGRVPHSTIFQYRHFDWRAMKLLARAATKQADALLIAVCEEFAKEGIQVLESSLFLKYLMPVPGLLTLNRPISEAEQADIDFGFPLAKAIAGFDIGQTIVVKDKMVVAVEGLEGTDKCIRRAGELAGPGCVVVKVCKPDQDLRFDIPVIGPGTVNAMADAKASALALSSSRSLVFHREQVVDEAEKHGIAIYIVDDVESGKTSVGKINPL